MAARFDQKEIQRLVEGVPTEAKKEDCKVTLTCKYMLYPHISLLQASFNGVTVKRHHLEEIPDSLTFQERLESSLKTWKEEGRRGIWLQIPTEKADVIPVATKLGFDFHHAQSGYAMLTKWLPEDEPNKLPLYASHYLGVGGFVLNEKNKLLLIQEKYLTSLRRPIWKIPGGLADPGENIAETAMREVKEETGIDTEFISLLCFRHMHQFRWGNSDFYFTCLLRPLTTDIVIDQSEIADCKWMKLEDYIADPDTLEINKLIAESFLSLREQGASISPTFTPHYRKGYPDLVLYSVKPMTATTSNSQDEKEKTANVFQPKL